MKKYILSLLLLFSTINAQHVSFNQDVIDSTYTKIAELLKPITDLEAGLLESYEKFTTEVNKTIGVNFSQIIERIKNYINQVENVEFTESDINFLKYRINQLLTQIKEVLAKDPSIFYEDSDNVEGIFSFFINICSSLSDFIDHPQIEPLIKKNIIKSIGIIANKNKLDINFISKNKLSDYINKELNQMKAIFVVIRDFLYLWEFYEDTIVNEVINKTDMKTNHLKTVIKLISEDNDIQKNINKIRTILNTDMNYNNIVGEAQDSTNQEEIEIVTN